MFKKLLTKRAAWFVLAIATFSLITLSAPQLQSHNTSSSPSLSTNVRPTYTISLQREAQATSGGRSSGGSFGKSGGSSSGGSSSGSSSSGSSSSGSSSSGGYSSGNSYSTSSGSSSSADSDAGNVLFGTLLLIAFIIWMFRKIYQAVLKALNFFTDIWLAIANPTEYKAQKAKRKAQAKAGQALLQQKKEIANDVVTVTQVQIAIYGEARQVQRALNKITTEVDWSTAEGLSLSLSKTTLTLLRASEYWSHASAHSQTVLTREAAKQQFDLLSIEERSKFDVESLVNVRGTIQRRAINHPKQESADYIVITMIVGTAHDAPLLENIHTTDELERTLKLLGTLPPDYLMVYEMLWSPQDESDCLTYEELLLNYPDMYQIS